VPILGLTYPVVVNLLKKLPGTILEASPAELDLVHAVAHRTDQRTVTVTNGGAKGAKK